MSHRMQITLTDAQFERLRIESGITGSPIAELVRRSIDAAHRPAQDSAASRLEAARAARGIWSDRGSEVFTGWRAMRGERPYVDR